MDDCDRAICYPVWRPVSRSSQVIVKTISRIQKALSIKRLTFSRLSVRIQRADKQKPPP
jgi:hypothetical protein